MFKFVKFGFLGTILVFGLLCSCSEETTPEPFTGNTITKINKIKPDVFKVGDTISVYGNNFGATRSVNYLEFEGTPALKNDYLSWSDTLIRVRVPDEATSGKVVIKQSISNAYDYTVNQHLLIALIDAFIYISLVMSIVQLYLRANKIWKRKHEREVADSQSLFGLSMLLVNCAIWVASYIYKRDYQSIIDTSIMMFEATVFLLIGTGLWVKGQKRLGLWTLIKQSLKLERKEANYLIKRFFKPQNAEIIIGILHQLAMIDEDLDVKEQEMIQMFANEWNIDYNVEKMNKERAKSAESNFIRLRTSMLDYLDREPPAEQVAQMKDMMNALIQADDKVSKEEDLIISELLGIVDNYLNKAENVDVYHVIIVPQRPEHEQKIIELLPDSTKMKTAGGIAYSIGSFYSHKYADMICRQFRQYDLFTIVYSPEEGQQLPANFME